MSVEKKNQMKKIKKLLQRFKELDKVVRKLKLRYKVFRMSKLGNRNKLLLILWVADKYIFHKHTTVL